MTVKIVDWDVNNQKQTIKKCWCKTLNTFNKSVFWPTKFAHSSLSSLVNSLLSKNNLFKNIFTCNPPNLFKV